MVDVGETSEFFKVLLDGFKEKLRIPDKFVSSFFRGQEKVSLNGSILGKVWIVEIRRHSNGLYFSGDGWREFVRDHDLRFGYFLVFTYHQNINFFVKTFDHSECRKLNTSINEEDNTMDHVQHSNFSGEKNNLSQKTVTLKPKVMKKAKNSLEEKLKVKKKPHFKTSMQPSYIDKKLMHFPDRFQFRKEGNSSFSQRRLTRNMANGRVTTSDKLKSVEKNLNVTKKSQFKISMAPTYIYKNFMSFPRKFRDANNLSTINEVTLTNNNGCWVVKFCHVSEKNRVINSLFSAGWAAFIRENNLKVGDVCIFELSSSDENRANFFVTKEVDHSRNHDHSNVSRQNKRRQVGNISGTITSKLKMTKKGILEKSLKIKKKPHFKINMTHTYINKYLHFPQGFRDANDLSTINEVILTNTNGCWPVKFHHKISWKNGPIRSVFSAGWMIFARENNLEIGDVCSFELSSKDEKRAIFFATKL